MIGERGCERLMHSFPFQPALAVRVSQGGWSPEAITESLISLVVAQSPVSASLCAAEPWFPPLPPESTFPAAKKLPSSSRRISFIPTQWIGWHLDHGFGVKRGKAICTCKILQVQKYSFCSLICLLTHMNTASISSKRLAVITRHAVSSNAGPIVKAE